jgi:hypothetical protein
MQPHANDSKRAAGSLMHVKLPPTGLRHEMLLTDFQLAMPRDALS